MMLHKAYPGIMELHKVVMSCLSGIGSCDSNELILVFY